MTGLAALAAGIIVIYRGRAKTYPALVVAQAGEIPVGGSKIFTYPTDVEPCILIHSPGDTYVAFSRMCTHASCPVYFRAGENRLDCPCHGGSFSAADGSVVSGPPPRPLPRIILERRGQELVATGIVKS